MNTPPTQTSFDPQQPLSSPSYSSSLFGHQILAHLSQLQIDPLLENAEFEFHEHEDGRTHRTIPRLLITDLKRRLTEDGYVLNGADKSASDRSFVALYGGAVFKSGKPDFYTRQQKNGLVRHSLCDISAVDEFLSSHDNTKSGLPSPRHVALLFDKRSRAHYLVERQGVDLHQYAAMVASIPQFHGKLPDRIVDALHRTFHTLESKHRMYLDIDNQNPTGILDHLIYVPESSASKDHIFFTDHPTFYAAHNPELFRRLEAKVFDQIDYVMRTARSVK